MSIATSADAHACQVLITRQLVQTQNYFQLSGDSAAEVVRPGRKRTLDVTNVFCVVIKGQTEMLDSPMKLILPRGAVSVEAIDDCCFFFGSDKVGEVEETWRKGSG